MAFNKKQPEKLGVSGTRNICQISCAQKKRQEM